MACMSCYRSTTLLFGICLTHLCLYLEKNILYLLMGIRLPSLPLSILYFYVITLFFVFNFGNYYRSDAVNIKNL